MTCGFTNFLQAVYILFTSILQLFTSSMYLSENQDDTF